MAVFRNAVAEPYFRENKDTTVSILMLAGLLKSDVVQFTVEGADVCENLHSLQAEKELLYKKLISNLVVLV